MVISQPLQCIFGVTGSEFTASNPICNNLTLSRAVRPLKARDSSGPIADRLEVTRICEFMEHGCGTESSRPGAN